MYPDPLNAEILHDLFSFVDHFLTVGYRYVTGLVLTVEYLEFR